MESLNQIRDVDVGIPLVADEFVEFHASRLLLLVHFAGISGRINGLMKMAKLDFFVRYPKFFARATRQNAATKQQLITESSMVKFHYGPWDLRYYDVLAYLSARDLITVKREDETVIITISEAGIRIAEELAGLQEFEHLVEHIKKVKRAFGSKTGTALKDIIYRSFNSEVAQLRLGQLILEE